MTDFLTLVGGNCVTVRHFNLKQGRGSRCRTHFMKYGKIVFLFLLRIIFGPSLIVIIIIIIKNLYRVPV